MSKVDNITTTKLLGVYIPRGPLSWHESSCDVEGWGIGVRGFRDNEASEAFREELLEAFGGYEHVNMFQLYPIYDLQNDERYVVVCGKDFKDRVQQLAELADKHKARLSQLVPPDKPNELKINELWFYSDDEEIGLTEWLRWNTD